jgi:hypothetical protein
MITITAYIIGFCLVMICSLPICKLIEILLIKFTKINTNLLWIQILIDIPCIILGYNISYAIVKLYAKHLGLN